MPSFAKGFFIEAAMEAIRDLDRAMNPWVETNKKQPPLTGTYLAFIAPERMVSVMTYSAEKNCWWYMGNLFNTNTIPTHWKHLSLPPNLEKE